MSRSEKKTDFWGNEYTQHYDDDGNKTGWSESKEDFWGDRYEQHYDQENNKSGWSEPKEDFWGDRYDQHHEEDGDKSGWSESKEGFWGDRYDQHYQQDGSKSGWSESKEDFWGDRYDQHYQQDGSKSGAWTPGSSHSEQARGSSSRSSGAHGSSASSGSGGGLLAVVLIVGFILVAGGIDDFIRVATTSPAEYSQGQPAPVATRAEPYSPPYHVEASFECAGELSWQQRAICSDAALAGQDVQVAELGRQLRESGHVDVERIDQRWREEWLRCGGSGSIDGCLSWVYRGWLDALHAASASTATPAVDLAQSGAMPSDNETIAATDGQAPTDMRSETATPALSAGAKSESADNPGQASESGCVWFNDRYVC